MAENLPPISDEIQKILQDPKNWYYKNPSNPLICKKCNKVIPENDTPLLLWKEDSNYMISFHMECIFPNLVKLTVGEEDESF